MKKEGRELRAEIRGRNALAKFLLNRYKKEAIEMELPNPDKVKLSPIMDHRVIYSPATNKIVLAKEYIQRTK